MLVHPETMRNRNETVADKKENQRSWGMSELSGYFLRGPRRTRVHGPDSQQRQEKPAVGLLLLQALMNDQRQLVSSSCCLSARRYRKISTRVAPVASAISGISPGYGRVAPDAAQTSLAAMTPRQRCTLRRDVRRCARLKRSGSVSGRRPSSAAAPATGSICNQPSTSQHTPSKEPLRDRQVRGALTPPVPGQCALAPHAAGRAVWPQGVSSSRPAAWA